MDRLIIVGAGGFGREVLNWARDAYRFGEAGATFHCGGFVDDNPKALDAFHAQGLEVPWLGPLATWNPQPNDRHLVAVGSPATKRKLVDTLLAKGARFATLIHPTAVVGPRVTLGEGTILCPRVVLTCDIRIGRWVGLNVGTAVGHDAQIGDFSQTSSLCDITGGVRIGTGVFLGSRVSVLPKIEVGDGATLGAGSVVVRRVRAGTTVFGVPAAELPGL